MIIPELPELQYHRNETAWNRLVMALIRPPKMNYHIADFGTNIFKLNGDIMLREQIDIPFDDTNSLQLSLFRPVQKPDYVILYLHGNSSSRLQCKTLLRALPKGFGLAAFDFLGCGLSRDAYISLGVRQAQQISTVVKYLQSNSHKVILWGRSMGAASALIYGGTFVNVLDSSFADIKQLCLETVRSRKPKFLPNCLIHCLFSCLYSKIRHDVLKKAKFDMDDLNIKNYVEKIDPRKCMIFLSGLQDELISHQHSEELYKSFKGQHKQIYLFEGSHNSVRNQSILFKVMDQIQSSIRIDKQKASMQSTTDSLGKDH